MTYEFSGVTVEMLDEYARQLSSGIAEESAVNPANGLPMINGIGGVDIEGNPYGADFSDDIICGVGVDALGIDIGCGSIDDSFSSTVDDSFVSGSDDSFSSSFDDSFSSSFDSDDW